MILLVYEEKLAKKGIKTSIFGQFLPDLLKIPPKITPFCRQTPWNRPFLKGAAT